MKALVFAPKSLGLTVIAIALIWTLAAAAPLRAEITPQSFLADLQEDVVQQLSGDLDQATREARFRKLLSSHFDLPTISRFVLGRYWRRATDQEREDFLAVFEDIMVQRFLPVLADETEARFEFGAAREDSRNPDVLLVASQVPRESGEPYKVIWRLKSDNGSYRILDVITEGVSMAITLRSEYGSFVKANNGQVSKLVESLHDKLARGAFTPKEE